MPWLGRHCICRHLALGLLVSAAAGRSGSVERSRYPVRPRTHGTRPCAKILVAWGPPIFFLGLLSERKRFRSAGWAHVLPSFLEEARNFQTTELVLCRVLTVVVVVVVPGCWLWSSASCQPRQGNQDLHASARRPSESQSESLACLQGPRGPIDSSYPR